MAADGPRDENFAVRHLEGEIRDRQSRPQGGSGAPQDGPGAGDKLFVSERLHQIVVGTGVQPIDPVAQLIPRR